MTGAIHTVLAHEHADDLRRAAEPSRVAAGTHIETEAAAIVLRLARADESHVMRRLAELDDAAAPQGPVLLALIDADPVAALSLSDGRLVANPFVRTTEAVALLRLRADHLSRPRASRRRIGRILAPRAV